jgi:hypothetical protein
VVGLQARLATDSVRRARDQDRQAICGKDDIMVS